MFAGQTWRKWSATIHLSRFTLFGIFSVCPLKNIEPVVDALRTLLSHHAKINSTLPDEQHHMVFEHVEFGRDRCFRESSTIVPDELIDVANYMYERYVRGCV